MVGWALLNHCAKPLFLNEFLFVQMSLYPHLYPQIFSLPLKTKLMYACILPKFCALATVIAKISAASS